MSHRPERWWWSGCRPWTSPDPGRTDRSFRRSRQPKLTPLRREGVGCSRPSRQRPIRVCQLPAMSSRCQRSSVSGLIGKAAQPGRASVRLSAASSVRSACVSFGREVCRRRIASSCRRTRISSSFERRGRASCHTSANRSGQRDTRTTKAKALPRPRQQRRT
jgi:hypothetical protein